MPHLVKVELIGETFLELPILIHMLIINIDRSCFCKQPLQKYSRIHDVLSNRVFQQNQYNNNSNDSSNWNKSFYDIFNDYPSKK